ncbi:MAG: hypothetical protein JO048_07785, partial [Methylobacteriaceae bacterium]|nr:hypothetical protein [Methylobacteriaceae bacterium]
MRGDRPEADLEAEVARSRELLGEFRTRLSRLSEHYDEHVERFSRRVALLDLRARLMAEFQAARQRVWTPVGEPNPEILPRVRPDLAAPRPGRRERRTVRERVDGAGLFDPSWYRRTYPDCAGLSDEAALTHFADHGVWAGRDPHLLVSSAWLERQAGGPARADRRPPIFALLDGAPLDPHPLFDTRFYLAERSNVASSGMLPISHFLRYGAREGLVPHRALDPSWYAARRGRTIGDPITDYLTAPEAALVSPHPLFDVEHYLAQVPWLREAQIPLLLHFLVAGWRENASPHGLFDIPYYQDRNPDVRAAGLNPFLHFLEYGARERRQVHPLFDSYWYLEGNPDVALLGVNPLVHYVLDGAREGRSPGPAFPARAFQEAFPTFDPQVANPVETLIRGTGLRLDVPRERGQPTSRRAEGEVYRLPDSLRDYLAARHGAEILAPIRDWMNLIDLYGDRPTAFEASEDLTLLRTSLTTLAGSAPAMTAPDASIIIPVHN